MLNALYRAAWALVLLVAFLEASPAPDASASWPLYRRTLANSGAAPGPAQVTHLELHSLWTYRAQSRLTSAPAVANGVVYAGTWSGLALAIDAQSGRVQWSTDVGANPDTFYGGPRGVIGSPAVAAGIAYMVSGSCTAAALDAVTGRVVWRRQICDIARNDDTYASPVVAAGAVLFGVDQIADRPTSRGYEIALDTVSGAERWRFYPQRYQGTGAGISATPAVDLERGLAFVGTGNPTPANHPPPGPDAYAESICALDLQSGRMRWAFGPVHPHDDGDNDLFASANLFTATVGGVRYHVVGEAGKDDVYYAVDENTGKLLWKRRLVPTSNYAMVIGTSAVGTDAIYVPVFENQNLGWIVALRSSDGAILWSKRMSGAYEAPALWGGVLFVTEAAGWIDALSARDGRALGRWAIDRPVLGRGPTIAGDTLYEASGQALHAFAIVH